MDENLSIEVNPAGLHPFVWGKMRWEFWLLIFLQVPAAILLFSNLRVSLGIGWQYWVGGFIISCGGTYIAGVLLTDKDPFLMPKAWRALRASARRRFEFLDV